jgi:hypothetical protein
MLKKVEEVDKGKVSISLADLDLEELLKVKASLKVLHGDIEATTYLLSFQRNLYNQEGQVDCSIQVSLVRIVRLEKNTMF